MTLESPNWNLSTFEDLVGPRVREKLEEAVRRCIDMQLRSDGFGAGVGFRAEGATDEDSATGFVQWFANADGPSFMECSPPAAARARVARELEREGFELLDA